MKKIFYLFLAISFIFAGCVKIEKEPEPEKEQKQERILPVMYENNKYSVLYKDNNTAAVYAIKNVLSSDKVNLTFPSGRENYVVQRGYTSDGLYKIYIRKKTNIPSADTFNITVQDAAGNNLINSDATFYTVTKIYPYYIDSNNQHIPYIDNDTFVFNTANETKTILFNQVTSITSGDFDDNDNAAMENRLVISAATMVSYGFDTNYNRSKVFENFTVLDSTNEEINYNGKQYPNCLKNGAKSECALQITNTKSIDNEAVFYMLYSRLYQVTSIKLKSTAQ